MEQQQWKEILLEGLKSELREAILTLRSPTFINDTNMAVNFETWQTKGFGYGEMVSILVLPGKKARLISSTGEWYLNTYLAKEFCASWVAAGIRPGDRVGKFRDRPCASGDYSWMDEPTLDIIYEPKKRTARFIKL